MIYKSLYKFTFWIGTLFLIITSMLESILFCVWMKIIWEPHSSGCASGCLVTYKVKTAKNHQDALKSPADEVWSQLTERVCVEGWLCYISYTTASMVHSIFVFVSLVTQFCMLQIRKKTLSENNSLMIYRTFLNIQFVSPEWNISKVSSVPDPILFIGSIRITPWKIWLTQ